MFFLHAYCIPEHTRKECAGPHLWPRGKNTAVTVRSPGSLSKLIQLTAKCSGTGHLSKKMRIKLHCSTCEFIELIKSVHRYLLDIPWVLGAKKNVVLYRRFAGKA